MSLADEIAANDLWNPYDFANPVDDRDLFAGRASELKDIRYYLRRANRAPRPINLVLTGPRSAGKTSLLNWIEQEALSSGCCVARVELNEGDTNPFSLFYKIYDAVVFAAATDGAFAGLTGQTYANYRATIDGSAPDGNSDLLFPRHYAAASSNGRPLSEPTFKRDLATIRNELQRPMIVLFDECDVLSTSRVELEMLRNVFMNTPGYMLVFAGTPNLFPVMEDVFSPIVRQFKKIPVERFTNVRDTRQCVRKPLEQLGIDPEDVLKPDEWSLASEVDRLSEGRPYEVQLLCHFMFKRVEDGDARDMAITLDVLDDVRTELEKQESGTGRRTLSALPKLDSDDFLALQALTEFQGTIEELSVRSHLFNSVTFSKEDLEAAFERFSGLGLLKRNDHGEVSFNGDQFDEVYARYYAAANDARLVIWKGGFWDDVQMSFDRLADAVPNVEVIYADIPSFDAKRRIQEALSALLDDAPPTSLPDVAAELYGPLLAAHERGSVTLAAVHITAVGDSVTRWLIISDGDEDAFLSSDAFVQLDGKAGASGVAIDVELFEYTLKDRGQFVDRAKSLASPNQREEFAGQHYSVGFDSYRDADYIQAIWNFEHALDFDPTSNYATSVAHVSLVVGDYSRALDYAGRGRELAIELDTSLDQYAFATYDAAVAQSALGNLETALLLVEECEAVIALVDESLLEGFLMSPRRDGRDIELYELPSEHANVPDAVQRLRDFITGA